MVVATCGGVGGGSESYEAGVRSQASIVIEMVDGLEGVTNEGSAKRAATWIEDLGSHLG